MTWNARSYLAALVNCGVEVRIIGRVIWAPEPGGAERGVEGSGFRIQGADYHRGTEAQRRHEASF